MQAARTAVAALQVAQENDRSARAAAAEANADLVRQVLVHDGRKQAVKGETGSWGADGDVMGVPE